MAHRWRIKNDELQMHRCNSGMHQPLIDTLGNGYSQITPIDEHLDLIETQYTTKRDFSVLNRIDGDQSRLVLTLSLQGCSRYVDNDGTTVEFNQGYTSVTSFNAIDGERQYQGGRNIHQLRFSIGKDWLIRHYSRDLVAELFTKDCVRSVSYRPTTPRGDLLSRELCAQNLATSANKLYAHGLILMLIASELAPAISVDAKHSVKLSRHDKSIADTAQDILKQEYRNPPSVERLAERVGTNAFKLKALPRQHGRIFGRLRTCQ